MKIAISGLLHGLEHSIEKKYPDLKIHFVGSDRDKKPKAPPRSSQHVFIMRRFCSHTLWNAIKDSFGSENICMVNGGMTDLCASIDLFIEKLKRNR